MTTKKLRAIIEEAKTMLGKAQTITDQYKYSLFLRKIRRNKNLSKYYDFQPSGRRNRKQRRT